VASCAAGSLGFFIRPRIIQMTKVVGVFAL